MDNHNLKGIETRLIQWINDSKNHTVQLIWDGKEDWFSIGEFASTENLNYTLANQIITVPFRTTKLFNRNNYSSKVVDSIIDALKETIKQLPQPNLKATANNQT